MIRGRCVSVRVTSCAGFSPLDEISWLTSVRVIAASQQATQKKMDNAEMLMWISQQMGRSSVLMACF